MYIYIYRYVIPSPSRVRVPFLQLKKATIICQVCIIITSHIYAPLANDIVVGCLSWTHGQKVCASVEERETAKRRMCYAEKATLSPHYNVLYFAHSNREGSMLAGKRREHYQVCVIEHTV